MISDSVAGLNVLATSLGRFLDSAEVHLFWDADISGSSQPYDRLLRGISFTKGAGPIKVQLADTLVLTVRGSQENLRTWCTFFAFPSDAKVGDHHHPEYVDRPGYIDPQSLPVIIEVSDPVSA